MTDYTTEIYVRGRWVRVAALGIDDKTIVITGRWLKMAIVRSEEWLETELGNPEQCIRQLKTLRPLLGRADIFTFTQKLPATHPQYPYRMEWDSVAAIRLTSFTEWWEKLPQETRKNARRSLKRGVVARVTELNDDLIRGIVEINNESPMRQGKLFHHYGKDFDAVRRDYSSFIDRSDFICAYLGEELIGLMKIVYSGKVAAILQLLSKSSHYDKRPTNALIAKAVERCEEKGISYITYGKYSYGNKRKSSLTEFKSRNGFEEILVPRFYVPLTSKGKICITLKLHRDLVGILPEKAICFGVNVRAKWYKLVRFASRCSSMTERPICNRLMGCSNPPAGSNYDP